MSLRLSSAIFDPKSTSDYCFSAATHFTVGSLLFHLVPKAFERLEKYHAFLGSRMVKYATFAGVTALYFTAKQLNRAPDSLGLVNQDHQEKKPECKDVTSACEQLRALKNEIYSLEDEESKKLLEINNLNNSITQKGEFSSIKIVNFSEIIEDLCKIISGKNSADKIKQFKAFQDKLLIRFIKEVENTNETIIKEYYDKDEILNKIIEEQSNK